MLKENKKLNWECAECGYIIKAEYPPVKCHQCSKEWQAFSGKQKKTGEKKWRCMVCGYIHVGEAPPSTCPKCGAGYEEFVKVK